MSKIRTQQQAIIDYSKAKPTYIKYKNTGYSKEFKVDNIEEITKFENAKQVYKELGVGGKLPPMNELKKEYSELKKELNSHEFENGELENDFKDMLNAQSNLELLLNINNIELATEEKNVEEFKKKGRGHEK